MAMATWARVIFGAASSVLAGTALAAGDVYDQFFRYTEEGWIQTSTATDAQMDRSHIPVHR